MSISSHQPLSEPLSGPRFPTEARRAMAKTYWFRHPDAHIEVALGFGAGGTT
jgi:hypothetical protein